MKYLELPLTTQEEIAKLAKKYGWKFFMKEYPYMLRLTKKFKYSLVKMNIYWDGRGAIKNVCTHMNHPKKGKNQLYRKTNLNELEAFFNNPRQHTNKGYRKKRS